ncbi:Imidazole glycerol phosphate synthase cyclase subunit [Candidatus Nasuia deltocephalinicola]|nr:Imidazole glycerol phosphate synthase cyclase subunit [Candidatus Nasuia deltocephalinicola]
MIKSYKRIIPCLDFYEGRIVKGINFKNLIDIGDPVSVSSYYNDEGADELVFLDISATIEKRSLINYYINKISSKIFIPLTVGGGIKNINDIKNIFDSGADKVSLNSSLLNNPFFIKIISEKYGSQCLVSALDVKKKLYNNSKFWGVYKNSGKIFTGFNIFDIIIKFYNLGVGEFLITSIDSDGTKLGFDLELMNKLSFISNISLISSGGAGKLIDILNIFKISSIDCVLLASILHNKKYTISYIKNYLYNNGVKIKL